MKAMVIQNFGEPSVFELTELPIPEVTAGHVLIQVKATSVNPVDTKIRGGFIKAFAPDFPAVLHGDVAGIVVQVGDGVSEFKPGDEVYGCAGGFKGTGGALAEYMLADFRLLAHKPKNITMEQAAALPLVAITAWEALFDRGNLKGGQHVLIHAATGGVGHVAIQLAKAAGATVYTTASSKEKLEIGKRLGADFTINYREETVAEYVQKYTAGKGFDIVFDTVGGENLDRSFEASALNGQVLAIAARSTHDLTPLHSKGLSFHVVFMLLKILQADLREHHGQILKQMNKIIEEGKLVPLIDPKSFTLEQVAEAHAYLESNKAIGKIVLTNKW